MLVPPLLVPQTAPVHARAAMVCAVRTASPGKPFLAAVRIRTDPGWHVYWKNPGDTGIATSISWNGPKGWRIEPLEWPTPKVIRTQETVSFAYEGETAFLARVTPGSGASGALRARVTWLVCKEACVPGTAMVSTMIRVGSKAAANPMWAKRLAIEEHSLPKTVSPNDYTARRQGPDIELVANGVSAGSLAFLPLDANTYDMAPPGTERRFNSTVKMTLKRSQFANSNPTRLRGLILQGRTASVVDLPIQNPTR